MNDQTTLQKALYTIKKLKNDLANQQINNEPIAIIGIGCRFPQAAGKNAYWDMLTQGKNVITQLPDTRWQLLQGTDEIALRDPEHPYWGGYLTDLDKFDAYYFGISPREAIRMDPHHRLLLEVAHEAIEDAGLSLDAISGSKTGVFASLYVSQLAHLQKMDTEMDALYLPTGNAISIAANRISYLFDLRGPSIIVDSACSSSMTSLHLACLNIQNQNCDAALVCGAKVNLLPYVNYVLTKAKMLSPDGQCKTFDEEANGYVQGEGVGVVVLKPLSKALKDKDRIYAVITGSAVNQDGRTNGLTAPNGLQQEELLRSAYASAKINPLNISYVECHGTGTFLGDPIELQALGEVVGKKREPHQPCWIGSVKTNLGHLEPAAGIASIIKVALALHKKSIPSHLNFNTPNPHIAFNKYNFKVPTTVQEWPKYGEYRAAGMSGFGFGGANSHIVMREALDEEKVNMVATDLRDHKKSEVFTCSAKNEIALKELVSRWISHLEQHPELELASVCYNSHLRRAHHPYRVAIVTQSIEELKVSLVLFVENNNLTHSNIFVGHEKQNGNITEDQELDAIDASSIAVMYVRQEKIDWKKYEAQRHYPVIDMPLYPWQHKSYWPPLGNKINAPSESRHPLHCKQIQTPSKIVIFEFQASRQSLPDLKDTYYILHAGYYLEMLAFATEQMTTKNNFLIKEHKFLSPIIVPNNELMIIQLLLEQDEDDSYIFEVFSCTQEQKKWLKNSTGKLIFPQEKTATSLSIDDIKARCPRHGFAEALYERIVTMGMPAGESIRWTHEFWTNDNEIICHFEQPASTRHNQNYNLKLHPSVIDACIQPLFQLLPETMTKPYIAAGAKGLHFFDNPSQHLHLWGKLIKLSDDGKTIIGDCYLINEKDQVIVYLEEVTLSQLDNKLHHDKMPDARSVVNLQALSNEEQRKVISQFLLEQTSAIFSLPKEDIRLNTPLRDLGIDSLMALVLLRAIEAGLGLSYNLQDLLMGPSIIEITNSLTKNEAPRDNTMAASRWISYRKKQLEPQIKLFCFPYGGGGASIYREWQEHLPATIEVCPIQLPGREERMDEKPVQSIQDLIPFLIEVLKKESHLPFAFFGHSFGSLIAFELTRELRRKQMREPVQLFISAFPDPRVPTKSLDKLLLQLKHINITLDDIQTASAIEQLTAEQLRALSNIFTENGIVGYGDYLLDKDILKVLLPIFIGDMSIVKSYSYYYDEPLEIPITVFAGKDDQWVSFDDHLKWGEHSSIQCEIVPFESGHMFIKEMEIRKIMLNKIANALGNIQELTLDV